MNTAFCPYFKVGTGPRTPVAAKHYEYVRLYWQPRQQRINEEIDHLDVNIQAVEIITYPKTTINDNVGCKNPNDQQRYANADQSSFR